MISNTWGVIGFLTVTLLDGRGGGGTLAGTNLENSPPIDDKKRPSRRPLIFRQESARIRRGFEGFGPEEKLFRPNRGDVSLGLLGVFPLHFPLQGARQWENGVR
jgi:hypothetical protein